MKHTSTLSPKQLEVFFALSDQADYSHNKLANIKSILEQKGRKHEFVTNQPSSRFPIDDSMKFVSKFTIEEYNKVTLFLEEELRTTNKQLRIIEPYFNSHRKSLES